MKCYVVLVLMLLLLLLQMEDKGILVADFLIDSNGD